MRNINVLIVEDDPQWLQNHQEFLDGILRIKARNQEIDGYKINIAGSLPSFSNSPSSILQTAQEYLNLGNINLVVTDWNLSGPNAYPPVYTDRLFEDYCKKEQNLLWLVEVGIP